MGKEFLRADHVWRARDKLHKVAQVTTAPKLFSELRKIVLTITDINDVEKQDKFYSGLSFYVRVEV